jgi:hypothetical protein
MARNNYSQPFDGCELQFDPEMPWSVSAQRNGNRLSGFRLFSRQVHRAKATV